MFYAQIDYNQVIVEDDLGNVSDEYQEYFFEALKQKGIGNYDRAVSALIKAKNISDKDPVVYFELGKNYNHLRQYDKAENALKTAVAKQPDNEWFLDELYLAYDKQKDYENAIKTVEKLVKFHPDYKEDLAKLYFSMQNYDKALLLLDELDELRGYSYNRDRLRNRIYKATGREEDGIKHLETRLKKNPNNEDNYLKLIYRYSANKQKDKAYKTAQDLLKLKPNSELVHLALYKFYLNDNKVEDAVSSMKKVLKSVHIKPKSKVKVLNDFVGFVKQHPEYEKDLVEVTTEVSNGIDSKSESELANYYLKKGNKPLALEHFEKAYTQDNSFSNLSNMLLLYIDLKRFEDAKHKSEAALVNYPSQPILYLLNGVALNNLNKPKQAISSLESGLDYIIDDTKMESDFYKQLAAAYTLLNNTSKAKTFNDKAKQLLQSLN